MAGRIRGLKLIMRPTSVDKGTQALSRGFLAVLVTSDWP